MFNDFHFTVCIVRIIYWLLVQACPSHNPYNCFIGEVWDIYHYVFLMKRQLTILLQTDWKMSFFGETTTITLRVAH